MYINTVVLNLIERILDSPNTTSRRMFDNAYIVTKTPTKYHAVSGVVVTTSRDGGQIEGLNLTNTIRLLSSRQIQIATRASADYQLTSHCARIEDSASGMITIVHTTDQNSPVTGEGACRGIIAVVVDCLTIRDVKCCAICRECQAVVELNKYQLSLAGDL